VATAPVHLWTGARRTAQRALAEAAAIAASLGGPASVRGWLVLDGASHPLGPIWYNIDPDCVEDVVIELIALAVRDTPANSAHRLVIMLQRFVWPCVSVTAVVDRRVERVELLACRGLDEDLGAGVWRDLLVLSGPELNTDEHVVVHKPTATVPADGGTRIEAVEPRLRGRATVPVPTGRVIARLAHRTAQRLGADLRLELALQGLDVHHLLVCRLTG
jgi:hypothetical protein